MDRPDIYISPQLTVTELAYERGFTASTEGDIEQPEFGGEDNL